MQIMLAIKAKRLKKMIQILIKIKQNKTNADDLNGCWEFSINEDGTLSITEYTGDKTNIIIPREINGKEVTEIGALTIPSEMESKLYKNKSVPALFIPDTINKGNL